MKTILSKKESTIVPSNDRLLSLITPMNLTIKSNQIIVGEYTGKVYGAVKYPQKVDYGWLSRLTNIPGTALSIGFTPIDNGTFIDSLSKSITLNRGNAESAKEPLARKRAEQAAIDAEKIMVQLDSGGETVGIMSLNIMPIAKSEEALEKTNRKAVGSFAVSKVKLRTMSSLQKEAFKSVSPYYGIDLVIEEIVGRILPLSTFTGGFPFASSGFNDGTGYYLGRDATGGLIIIDPWIRGNDRTNSNMTIMGVAGTGKSTAIKSIAISEYMKGTKLIFIDVEREYKDLCQNLNGDWINCGAGMGGMLNPLQIRAIPKDDDEETIGDMALYLKTLETFFSLYLSSLTMKQKALLKQNLIELYNAYNIYWNTDISALRSEDFPTFSDLYTLIELKAETEPECRELLLLLKDIASGSDSFIWNGVTNIKTDSRCVCFDTFELQNSTDNVKRAQYFNLLSYCWQIMSENREERVLLIADEAYMMIDPNVPQSLVFLRNMEKRARKYEAAVAIISHSVVDFLSPEVKMYGQALLDIPSIKILFGTDGANLKETKELYNLTEAEEELLSSKRRAQALVMIGSKRMKVNFEIPSYKFNYIGKAGGR